MNVRREQKKPKFYFFRLAYIGVIQFGPQKLKEKDQVFLYVNKNTCLMDTTSSIPGYHQVGLA